MIARRSILRQCRGIPRYHLLHPARRRLPSRSLTTSTTDPAGTGFDSPDHAHAEAAPAAAPPAESPFLNDVAFQYEEYQRQQRETKHVGSVHEPVYDPLALLEDPPSASQLTLAALLAAQTHLGHHTSHWHPSNASYIAGVRLGTHIISLEATSVHLRRAARVVRLVTRAGGLVLFVGTRKGHLQPVTRAAERAGGCHVAETRWRRGTLTNAGVFLERCAVAVVDRFDRPVAGGVEAQVKDLSGVLKPDLVVVLNCPENRGLLRECAALMIPTIGVVDTDVDPATVTYPVPANDDSLRSIALIAGVLGKAGEQGRAQRLAAAARGILTYTPAEGLRVPAPARGDGNEEEEGEREQRGSQARETEQLEGQAPGTKDNAEQATMQGSSSAEGDALAGDTLIADEALEELSPSRDEEEQGQEMEMEMEDETVQPEMEAQESDLQEIRAELHEMQSEQHEMPSPQTEKESEQAQGISDRGSGPHASTSAYEGLEDRPPMSGEGMEHGKGMENEAGQSELQAQETPMGSEEFEEPGEAPVVEEREMPDAPISADAAEEVTAAETVDGDRETGREADAGKGGGTKASGAGEENGSRE